MDAMPHSAHEACAIVRELRSALATLGDALAAHDLDAMLAAEPQLAAAASALDRLEPARPLPESAREDLAAARLALRRCERLGNGFRLFVAAMQAAQGSGPEYARRPGRTPADGRPRLTARA